MADSKEPYQSVHSGAEIDAGIDLLDKNSATQGQVLTANGSGGASWQDASGGGGGVSEIANGFTVTVLNNYSNGLTFYDKDGNSHTGTGTFYNINYIKINGMLWSNYQIITGAVIAYIYYNGTSNVEYFNRQLMNFASPNWASCTGYFIPLSDLTINNTGD